MWVVAFGVGRKKVFIREHGTRFFFFFFLCLILALHIFFLNGIQSLARGLWNCSETCTSWGLSTRPVRWIWRFLLELSVEDTLLFWMRPWFSFYFDGSNRRYTCGTFWGQIIVQDCLQIGKFRRRPPKGCARYFHVHSQFKHLLDLFSPFEIEEMCLFVHTLTKFAVWNEWKISDSASLAKGCYFLWNAI